MAAASHRVIAFPLRESVPTIEQWEIEDLIGRQNRIRKLQAEYDRLAVAMLQRIIQRPEDVEPGPYHTRVVSETAGGQRIMRLVIG